MSLAPLKEKPFVIKDMDGVTRTFILSRMPATVAREVLCQYPLTAMPKIGDYKSNEALMLKMMGYVFVDNNGTKLALSTQALVDNHTNDAETLMRLEHAMLEHNCFFFQSGKASTFFDECVQMFLAKITEMSTPSSPRSSKRRSARSTS